MARKIMLAALRLVLKKAVHAAHPGRMPREAAELLGTTRAHALTPAFGDEAAPLDDTDRWIHDVLGDGAADQRMAVGAVRSIDDAALTALTWITARHASSPCDQ